MGVIPIIIEGDFFSCACGSNLLLRVNDSNKNIFIPSSTKLNYGDCSLMAERVVVVRKTRVQFPPFTLKKRR